MSTVKVISSGTIFNDAIGMRGSWTYSEIDEDTGTIVNDNIRFDKVLVKPAHKSAGNEILAIGQEFLDAMQ